MQSNNATIYCFEHDGTLKWESQSVSAAPDNSTGPAIALADIDVDGDVEIIFENLVLDHHGQRRAHDHAPEPMWEPRDRRRRPRR